MSKLRKILRMSLFMPMSVIMGVGAGAASGGAANGSESKDKDEKDERKPENGTEGKADSAEEKTFTQAEVNKLMKAEKESGRRSVLKELGMDDIKTAKDGLEEYKKILESQKTDAQKQADKLAETEKKLAEEKQRAAKAEAALMAVAKGANANSADELVSIALTKVEDGKDISAVLDEMKKSNLYSGFFEQPNENVGTGSSPQSNSRKPNTGSFGAELAKKNSSPVKSSYFSN